MIRALVVFLGLFLGLAGAVVLGGTAAHLRLIGAERVAPWLAALEDRAGLLQGRARVEGAVVDWRLSGVDTRGPRWAVDLTGGDWRVTGVARVVPGGLRVQGLRGLMPLALLMPDARGEIAPREGGLELALPSLRVTRGQIDGVARGLAAGGSTFERAAGDGPVTVWLDGGVWRMANR